MNPIANAGLQWNGPRPAAFSRVLTPEALAFVAGLARRFHWHLEVPLAPRPDRQQAWDGGAPGVGEGDGVGGAAA